MKIEGSSTIQAAPARTFALLIDEDVLRRCVPGVRRLIREGEDRFAVILDVGFGSVEGTYEGRVALSEKVPPSRLQIAVDGQGRLGFVRGKGLLQLESDEKSGAQLTRIAYQGEVQIGGALASVGQRMVQGAARAMVGQFFAAIEAEAKAAESQVPVPVKHGRLRNLLRWLRSILRGLFQRRAVRRARPETTRAASQGGKS